MQKPCIVCGALSATSRCPAHRLRNGSTRKWRSTRTQVLQRDLYRCNYCGGYADTVDHKVPVAAGGTDHPTNLVAACDLCNKGKGAT